MKMIGLFALISLFITSVAWGEAVTYDKKCTAVVRGQAAQFIFPLPNRQTWTWNMKETTDNYQEYSWDISLAGPESSSTYNFGLYLFKFANSKEVTGSIDQLIADAQTSVWDQSSSVRKDLIVESTIENQKLVITVSDKKTFSELFSQNPTIAYCRVNTPYQDINFVSRTRIEFKK
jgi:ligand-binding SRPBCC domain-containing protein